MRVFGREVVHLNSGEAALELLGGRSSIYSDRPRQVMGGELVGRSRSVVFQPYGPRLRTSRRLLIDFVGARAARAYWPAQEHAAARLVVSLARSPEKFVAHINGSVCLSNATIVVFFFVSGILLELTLTDQGLIHCSIAAEIVTRLAYGYTVAGEDDRLVSARKH